MAIKRTIAIDMTWLIGTDPTCAVRVDDPYASGVHCRIDRVEGGAGWLVSDLGSTNGTWIRSPWGDRRRVRLFDPIHSGEILVVGRSELVWGQETAFRFSRAVPSPLDVPREGVNMSEKLPHDPLCEGDRCGCGKRAFPDD